MHAYGTARIGYGCENRCASPTSSVSNLHAHSGPRLSQRAASPPTSQFPYGGAKIDGLPGSQKGGFQVPAPGDTAHQFQPPPAGAQRGPCPGLNAMANHAFISSDGITTFDELVAAQQNVRFFFVIAEYWCLTA